MKRRRKAISEINLTPLLDVLFSILFIVMMTGMQNESGLKEEHNQQISKLENEVSGLEEELKNCQNQMSSVDMYQSEAVILTISNTVEDDEHYLTVKQGLELVEIEKIQLGTDKTENTKTRILDLMKELVEKNDNQPVYIVFYCDKQTIYTLEYNAVTEAFYEAQETYKEVFFKVMEEKENG